MREAEAFEGVGEVYQAIDRPNEAAKFYRQAAKEYLGHQEWWRLAVCLGRSASVMIEDGDSEAAGGQWRRWSHWRTSPTPGPSAYASRSSPT